MMKFRNLLLPILAFVSLWSCENADFDDNLQFENPADLIAEDSELFGLLELMTTDDPVQQDLVCVEFIYPFTGIIYDEEGLQIARETIDTDQAFLLFLGSVLEGQYINVSFPIEAMLQDGSTFAITTKEELQTAILDCVEALQEQVITECNGIADSEDCVWKVLLSEDADFNTYENAVFDVNASLETEFFHRGIRYEGTWIFLYVENELFLNISLEDPEMVGEDWNINWKVEFYGNELIKISNEDGVEFELTEVCDEEEYCTLLEFTECNETGIPEDVEFPLEDYLPCIEIMAAPQDTEDTFLFSFFTTEVDADANTNPIDTSVPYTGVPETAMLYVRIENENTGEFEIVEITLIAETCE